MTKERLRLFSLEDLQKIAERGNIPYKNISEKELLIDSIIENCREDREEREGLLNFAMQIEAMKYSVSIDEEIDIYFDEYHEFPQRYNEMKIVFLLRDPSWGFVYWDIENEKLLEIKNSPGFGGFFLRAVELSDSQFNVRNIIDYYDIPVNFEDLDQYINLPERESFYCVELYYRDDDEEHFVMRSNILQTSRTTISTKGGNADTDKLIKISGFADGLIDFPDKMDIENIPQRIFPMDTTLDEEDSL